MNSSEVQNGFLEDRPEVDFRYFISLAVKKKLLWDSVLKILDEMSPTFFLSKQLNYILLEQLKESHSKQCQDPSVHELDGNVQETGVEFGTENFVKMDDFESVKTENNEIELNDEVYSEGEHYFDSDDFEIEFNDELYYEDEQVSEKAPNSFENGLMKNLADTFKCNKCHKTFRTKGNLKTHEVIHTNPPQILIFRRIRNLPIFS